MIRVELVIYPEFKLFEAVSPMTVFHYANKHLELINRKPYYDVHLMSSVDYLVKSDTGASLPAHSIFAAKPLAHTVLLVGSHDILTAVAKYPEISDWVREIAPQTKRLVGLCSGAFFLAATGLLDGKKATTHWRMSDALKRLYPKIEVDSDAIFIQQQNIWTSAGVSAATDLALAFVEQDLGQDIALNVARDLVVHLKRPGGQSQFSIDLNTQMNMMSPVRHAQQWMLEHLSEPIHMPDVAAAVKMSLRSFNRIFMKETGITPSDFLERGRLERARRMIADSDRPLKNIAFEAGFLNDERMRHVFQKHFDMSPSTYKKSLKTQQFFAE